MLGNAQDSYGPRIVARARELEGEEATLILESGDQLTGTLAVVNNGLGLTIIDAQSKVWSVRPDSVVAIGG
ncbi:hypothetical protein [Streptomyces sp. NPDC096153]|uniref:hypothetical protein n=1 Tax=Streptomyces sp. NPDC096153 TaxID=3155548 RepID=UPI00332391EC